MNKVFKYWGIKSGSSIQYSNLGEIVKPAELRYMLNQFGYRDKINSNVKQNVVLYKDSVYTAGLLIDESFNLK